MQRIFGMARRGKRSFGLGGEPELKVSPTIRHLVLALGKDAEDIEKSLSEKSLDTGLQLIALLSDVREGLQMAPDAEGMVFYRLHMAGRFSTEYANSTLRGLHVVANDAQCDILVLGSLDLRNAALGATEFLGKIRLGHPRTRPKRYEPTHNDSLGVERGNLLANFLINAFLQKKLGNARVAAPCWLGRFVFRWCCIHGHS